MFKIVRTFPNFSQRRFRSLRIYRPLLIPSRRSFITHNGPFNVQHVRIKRSPFYKRLSFSVFRPLVIFTLFFGVPWILLDDDSDEEEEEEEEEHTTEDGTTDEQNKDDTIFLPLGFAYRLPKKYYKGEDPEWQSFVKLSQNAQLCDYLKSRYQQLHGTYSAYTLIDQLAGTVGQILGPMAQFQKSLGEDNHPQKFWLDIDFPQCPPPEYERKGTMTSLQYAKLKNALDFTSPPQASTSEDSNTPNLKLQQTSPQKKKSASASDRDVPTKNPTSIDISRQLLSKGGTSKLSKMLPVMPTPYEMGEDTESAVSAFQKTFSSTWRPATAPERGTVIFSGMVELVGSKGVAVLDVLATALLQDEGNPIL
ncbi:MAG: hypothetical protein Q9219_003661 [cf. Caloplaca sp. 3 TL-2023]